MPRLLLFIAAALLVGTSVFHLTGLEAVSTWVPGQPGAIVRLLWVMAAVTWIEVALIWVLAGFRRSPVWREAVLLIALIPATFGGALAAGVDAGHPGAYLLLASAAIAVIGAAQLR